MSKTLKEIAKESEEKGYQKVWDLYKKFDSKLDKFLSEILDEKEDQKFGIFDLWKWLKDKFNRVNKKIEIKDNELLEDNKKN